MNPDQEIRKKLKTLVGPVSQAGVWASVERRAKNKRKPLNRYFIPAAVTIVLVAGVSVGILEAVAHLEKPRQILVIGDETTTTMSAEAIAQSWYEDGSYMGFWAGNVETIPAKPKDLPDFFYSGRTPARPVAKDGQGNPIQEDPARIKKPLWVFGDEVRVADYADQIRQAEKDGRPVLFYATRVPDAVSALGLKDQGGTDTPLERLIVEWLPWDNARDGTVGAVTWTIFVGPPASMIFLELVDATLNPPRTIDATTLPSTSTSTGENLTTTTSQATTTTTGMSTLPSTTVTTKPMDSSMVERASAAATFLASSIISGNVSVAKSLVDAQAQAMLAQLMASLKKPYGYMITSVGSVSQDTVRVFLQIEDHVDDGHGGVVQKSIGVMLEVRVGTNQTDPVLVTAIALTS